MGAPVNPRDPPTTSTDPARYFVDSGPLLGPPPRTAASSSECSCPAGSRPIGVTCTDPEWNRPGATASPSLAAPNVTVAAARTAAPGVSPVEATTPDGTSTATTGFPEPLIRSIIRATSSRGASRRPMPSRASTITSGSPSSPNPSTTATSRPRSRSTRAHTRPSPPLFPPPQTTATRPGKRSATRSATAVPARSISSSSGPSCASSARRVSSAVRSGRSPFTTVSLRHHHRNCRRQVAGVRHGELDPPRADPLGHLRRPAAQLHPRLGPADHLDLLPGEVDARPERLPHRLLCREPTRVVLGRVRLRVAVLPFRLGEAAGPEAVSVAL